MTFTRTRIALVAVLAAFAALALTHAVPQAATTGPVAAYSFDEGTGTVAHDASGNGNDGTIVNGAWASRGYHAGALSFNGTSTRVAIPQSASLQLSSGFTVEAWVDPTSLGGWRAVAVKEQSNELDWALYADSQTNGTPAGIANTGSEQFAYGTGAVATSAWTHLAATSDGSTLRLYVDGSLVRSTPVSGSLAQGSGPLSIGGDAVWGEWFSGTIDDVRVYGRALSASELGADMQTAVAGSTSPAATPPPAAPATPTGLSVGTRTTTSVQLSWTPNGAASYDVSADGKAWGSTSSSSTTVSGLACGTSHTFGVDARNAAGATSSPATVTASTAACATAGDTTPPSTPTGLAASATTQTSVSLAWTKATDNVGVTGYGVYRNGTLVTSGTSTSATVGSLACGTSSTFAVDAVDAAGNRSAKASLTASTAACSTGTGGTSGSVFVSPSGSDSAACDQTHPCLTLNRAYAVAKPGGTVQVAAGTYGAQTILKGSQSQTGPAITFACAGGGTCTIGGLTLGQNNGSLSGDAPSYVTFNGLNIAGGSLYTYLNQNADPLPTNLTYENAKMSCTSSCSGLVKTNSYSNFTLENVDLGPACCDGDAIEIGLPRQGAATPSNVVLDRVRIHDIYDSCSFMSSSLGPCSGTGYESGCSSCDHVDGIQVYGVNGFTMTNSSIYAINPGGNVGQGLFMQPANGGVFSNILVENSMFDTTPNNNVSISGPGVGVVSGNVRFLYNTIRHNLELYGDSTSDRPFAPSAKVVIAGNVIQDLSSSLNNSCQINASDGSSLPITYVDNLVGNRACGSTDHVGTPTYVSTTVTAPNLHLTTASTNAIDKGESTWCPSKDFDAQARPLGVACDLGADEVK